MEAAEPDDPAPVVFVALAPNGEPTNGVSVQARAGYPGAVLLLPTTGDLLIVPSKVSIILVP